MKTPIAMLAAAVLGLTPGAIRHSTPLRSEIKLTLVVPKSSYLVGEVVAFDLVATNVSTAPVEAFLGLDPRIGQAVLWRGTSASTLSPAKLEDKRFGLLLIQRKKLLPGASHLEGFPLSLGTAEGLAPALLLNAAGEHFFRVVYEDTASDPNGILESNLVRVQVEAPTPSEAANYSIDLAHLAQFDESRTAIADTVPSAAEQFLNSFSESAYAPGVRSGLKRYLMARIRRDLATDSERAIFERLFAGGTEARVRFDAARSKARQSR